MQCRCWHRLGREPVLLIPVHHVVHEPEHTSAIAWFFVVIVIGTMAAAMCGAVLAATWGVIVKLEQTFAPIAYIFRRKGVEQPVEKPKPTRAEELQIAREYMAARSGKPIKVLKQKPTLVQKVSARKRLQILERASQALEQVGRHRHHHPDHGDPVIRQGDTFILIKNPLSAMPLFYAGRYGEKHHFSPLRSRAQRFDHVLCAAWATVLNHLEHDVYMAPGHDDIPVVLPEVQGMTGYAYDRIATQAVSEYATSMETNEMAKKDKVQHPVLEKVGRREGVRGFSLIELLIVVAIILIIAAIAIPNLLSARMAANGASAVGNLRAIASANGNFASLYRDGYAAGGFVQLAQNAGNPPSCQNAALLSSSWALAQPALSGYNFAYTAGAVVWTSAPPSDCGASGVTTFDVTATPVATSTAKDAYCIDETGTIYVVPNSTAQLSTPCKAGNFATLAN